MQKKLSAVGGAIIVAALIFVGVYGYARYKVKEKIDQIITTLPYAGIEYETVNLSFAGTVGIEGATISPHLLPGKINVGAILLDAKSLKGLFKFMRQNNKNHGFPDDFEIAVNDLELNLTSELFASAPRGEKIEKATLSAMEAMGCGDVDSIGPKELMEMGYSIIKIDHRVGFHVDRPGKKIKINLSLYAEEFFSLTLDINLATDASSLDTGNFSGAAPKLLDASLHYVDRSYNFRKNLVCAKKEGLTVEEYIDKHIQLLGAAARKNKIELNDEIKFHYKEYLIGPGDGRISIRPEQPLELMAAMTYKPQDLVTILDPRLKINGKEISGVKSISLDILKYLQSKEGISTETFIKAQQAISQNKDNTPDKISPKPVKQTAKAAPPPAKEKQPKAEKKLPETRKPSLEKQVEKRRQETEEKTAKKVQSTKKPALPHFRNVPVAQIREHVGREAIVYTKDGRRFSGTITRAGNLHIEINSRLTSGTIKLPVEINDIETANVYY